MGLFSIRGIWDSFLCEPYGTIFVASYMELFSSQKKPPLYLYSPFSSSIFVHSSCCGYTEGKELLYITVVVVDVVTGLLVVLIVVLTVVVVVVVD